MSVLDAVPLTVRHTYMFRAASSDLGGTLVSPNGWDLVRERVPPFELPGNRTAWERRALASPDLQVRARVIAATARELGATRVASYGVGTAMLELLLHRELPEVALTCTDFAPRTVERLRALFPEAEVVLHDLRRDPPLDADLHLLHRVDSELRDDEWRRVLPRFRKPVLFAATQVLDVPALLKELLRRVQPGVTDAGWVRTEGALRRLWKNSHADRRLSVGSLTGFVLTPH